MLQGEGLVNFIVICVFVFAVGGLMYLYAKMVGKGEAKAAFQDPNDRKRVFIVSAGILVFFGIIFAILVIAGVLKF